MRDKSADCSIWLIYPIALQMCVNDQWTYSRSSMHVRSSGPMHGSSGNFRRRTSGITAVAGNLSIYSPCISIFNVCLSLYSIDFLSLLVVQFPLTKFCKKPDPRRFRDFFCSFVESVVAAPRLTVCKKMHKSSDHIPWIWLCYISHARRPDRKKHIKTLLHWVNSSVRRKPWWYRLHIFADKEWRCWLTAWTAT